MVGPDKAASNIRDRSQGIAKKFLSAPKPTPKIAIAGSSDRTNDAGSILEVIHEQLKVGLGKKKPQRVKPAESPLPLPANPSPLRILIDSSLRFPQTDGPGLHLACQLKLPFCENFVSLEMGFDFAFSRWNFFVRVRIVFWGSEFLPKKFPSCFCRQPIFARFLRIDRRDAVAYVLVPTFTEASTLGILCD